MTILYIYLVGFVIVWIVDKIASPWDNDWEDILARLILSVFSWATLIVFLFLLLINWIEIGLPKVKNKPPKWL